MKLKNFLLCLCLFVFTSCSGSIEANEEIKLNLYNCKLSQKNNSIGVVKNEIYIVGHAYGKPGEGDFFPNNLIKYFSTIENLGESYIALTGDFVRVNSIESLENVKNYIKKNFKDFFIAIGNHEIENTRENFDIVFESDFYFKEFNNFLLISANFSNSNWLPTKLEVEKINKLINSSEKETVIILSHQIFWLEEIENVIKPNSDALLRENLKLDSLDWIEKNQEKYMIVISGDYGAWGDQTYCYLKNNKLFIANGIGDHPNDTILKITDYEKSFEIEEISINN